MKHDRKVALKVLKPELGAVLGAERFVVEIKTTASLQHPHILPLFDWGTGTGSCTTRASRSRAQPHPLMIRIGVSDLVFLATLERERAPATVAALLRLLPLSGSLLQARWSGEAAWMPLGGLDVGVGAENDTQRPRPGQILVHPNGISETEILIPYGETVFASKAGPLRGNHVMTIVEGEEQLPELGRRVLWEGAQSIRLDVER